MASVHVTSTWASSHESGGPPPVNVCEVVDRRRESKATNELCQLIRDDNGRVRNTRLVRWPGESQPRTAGECWAGYARP